jgi:CheY-like chemotaxis protein
MIVSLADDDEKFCKHVEKWFKQADLSAQIQLEIFPDPRSLLSSLRTKSRKPTQKMLVLLDLDFHGDKEGGLKALTKIKTGKSNLRKVPVVIYTNSRDASEIDRSYLNLANSFVWKGHGGKQKRRFTELIAFWNSISSVPNCGLSTT